MGKKVVSTDGRKTSPRSMHDRYWKQVLAYAEKRQWRELDAYLDNYPWLATAFMGPNVLPEYLAAEKEYGLLRLLCNIEDVPLDLVKKLIERGARDRGGRGYLERLLAGDGAGATEADRRRAAAADSPLIAAEVLKTCEFPAEVIEKMQQILEQGLQDDNGGRRALAERCIGRSQLFYDLLMLLYAHDAVGLLRRCLGREKLLELAAEGNVKEFKDVEKILAEQ